MKRNYQVFWCVLAIFIGLLVAPFLTPLIDGTTNNTAYLNPLTFTDTADFLNLFQTYYTSLLSGRGSLSSFLICLAVSGIIAGAIVMSNKSSTTDSIANNSVLGNSELIDSPRLRAKKNDRWDGNGKPHSAGLVFGYENGYYLYDSTIPHQLIVGKTGSGKSRYTMIETVHLCIEAGCNLIISDLKNEIIELTGARAAQCSNVVLYDLENPLKGNRYNPLDLIVDYAEARDVASMVLASDKLAANLIPAEEKNPFFSNAARGLLSACFIAVAMADIPGCQKNMASVCMLFDKGTTAEGKDPSAPLKDFLRSLGSAHPAFSPASEFLSDGGTTAGKNVLSTVKVALRPFSSPAIRWMTAKSDPKLEDLILNRTTLYIHVLSKDSPANSLLACFFSQWWERVQQIGEENGGAIPIKTKLVLDEFGSFPKIPLASILNLGRSYGVSWYGFLQSTTQLAPYNRPGDAGAGAKEVLANVGCKVALSLSEKADRDYFTELCGKRAVMARGQSSSKNGRTSSSGTSSSERADDLIHSWEWSGRSPDSDGAIVVKAKENGVEDRNGVFRMPLVDATKTPARKYFDLGTREHEKEKRLHYRRFLDEKAAATDVNDVDVWHVDFDSFAQEDTEDEPIEADEFSAWDMED